MYSPSYVPGLSLTADYWRIYLNNIITTVGAQSVLNLCFAGNTLFCPLIKRSANPSNPGQITQMLLPTGNLGRFDVKGVDFSANYKLPQFSFGQFNVGVSGTYMIQAKVQSAPGQPGNSTLNYVGVMGSTGSSLQASCPGGAPGAGLLLPACAGHGRPWLAVGSVECAVDDELHQLLPGWFGGSVAGCHGCAGLQSYRP